MLTYIIIRIIILINYKYNLQIFAIIFVVIDLLYITIDCKIDKTHYYKINTNHKL